MKRIGILTSGGDTPGMNAAIRATLKAGLDKQMTVMGIYHGYQGLMEGRIKQMQYSDVHNIIDRGGTILRTARSEVFKTPEGLSRALQIISAYDIEGLIVIGGDGTFCGARALSEKGVPVVCIPGTIDNDMGYTDFTIGFDTAVNNVMHEISKIRDTMRAHDRVGVVEVMGRQCGDIALWAGITGPADITLLPEVDYPWEKAAQKLVENKLRGRLTSMVIIAEGAGKAVDFAKYIEENTDVEIKPVTLGYIQRGGNPSAQDRMLATKMCVHAVELLDENCGGRAVGIRDNKIIDVPLSDAIAAKDVFDHSLYNMSEMISKF
ncbi:6-phosphofructokinase [Eubacteriales bacterium OttesenSCG-928-K08]|nr:6-phosphofructokinase [Eubacteriales bacterium OttesenSCG-928-K08]